MQTVQLQTPRMGNKQEVIMAPSILGNPDFFGFGLFTTSDQNFETKKPWWNSMTWKSLSDYFAKLLSDLGTIIEDIAAGGHAPRIEDKLVAFDDRAFDYVNTPLDPVELALRIKALLKHDNEQPRVSEADDTVSPCK
jgi:hypothetical protein